MPRGRHSGANPQRPPRPEPKTPPQRVTGDLMEGRGLFEPFTPAKDNEQDSED